MPQSLDDLDKCIHHRDGKHSPEEPFQSLEKDIARAFDSESVAPTKAALEL
jgi:hypothetical protein